MKILYAAPVAKRYRAMEHETRLAADHGHEVHLVADHRLYWERHEVDPRVRAHLLRVGDVRARESALVTWLLCRMPRGVLRRLRRGPLTRVAGGVLRLWNRKVANPIEKRRKRRTHRMRQGLRRDAIMDLLETHRFDWLVIGGPGVIDVLADDLPALLERRPELRTTYSYEHFADEEAASVR
ncbi:hypothetical protein GCM10027447_23360 [Glycomyces halotolerans]